MKTIFLSTFIVLCTVLSSFAQEKTQGFYINPNLQLAPNKYYFGGGSPGLNLSPELVVGYLWGKKNRQNISIYNVNGSWNHSEHTLGIDFRYSYDFRLYSKERMKFYISPYAHARYNFSSSKKIVYLTGRDDIRNSMMSIIFGISPQFEFQLGKHTDLVISTPLNLVGISGGHFKQTTDSTNKSYNYSSNRINANFEANIGLRINLFSKK